MHCNAEPIRAGGLKKGIELLAPAPDRSAATGVGAQTKLRFAPGYETSAPHRTAARRAAGETAKRTNNRQPVELVAAATLGKAAGINQGLAPGTVDIIDVRQLVAGRTCAPLAIGGARRIYCATSRSGRHTAPAHFSPS